MLNTKSTELKFMTTRNQGNGQGSVKLTGKENSRESVHQSRRRMAKNLWPQMSTKDDYEYKK